MKFRLGNPDKGGFARAFGDGLLRHGLKETSHVACDLLVLWGTRRQREIDAQKARGGKVVVLERGYLGDRYSWTSISFGGGLNGRGNFTGPFHDGSRWEKHFAHLMKPWRTGEDGYALILEQVPGDMSVRGVNLRDFYSRARDAFTPLINTKVRPHPRTTPLKNAEAHQSGLRSLVADLEGARLAVTWNSNSGVDAVLAGVPTIAMDEGSMAWDVTGHKLKMPPAPDREKWAHALAWKQYSVKEMASGFAWDAISGLKSVRGVYGW